uniref:Uncharacterized protein n=1 Tax=Ditylenchus dipsaci TaxID=166011 RepID=A0A915CRG6_9BILA
MASKDEGIFIANTLSQPTTFSRRIIQPEAATISTITVDKQKKERFHKLDFKLSPVLNPATLLLATHQHSTITSTTAASSVHGPVGCGGRHLFS